MRTIGEFYKDEILSLPREKTKIVELPSGSGKSRIEQDLFGWRLYQGKDSIECHLEEEARYLKLFLDSYVTGIVCVPIDDDYLKMIVPRLEKLKKKIDEIIEFRVDGILNRLIQEQARHSVYSELIKEVYEFADKEENDVDDEDNELENGDSINEDTGITR